MNRNKILIVDDEESILYTYENILSKYELELYGKSIDAANAINSGKKYDLALVDLRMQGMTGIDILKLLKEKMGCNYKALLITAFSEKVILETIINQNLIYKVINKPFDNDELLKIVEEAIESLVKENTITDEKIRQEITKISRNNNLIIHRGLKMKELMYKAEKYAQSNANIILEGESGVGKEVIATYLHLNSKRSAGPFIKVNCASIPESLFEAELFGVKKGAFTGATMDKKGKFLLADKGTLLLDEISELSMGHQAKLLRTIENMEVSPIGSECNEIVDVRVICASNKDLSNMVNIGKFREDLLYRLNILSIKIPNLNSRNEDISLLAQYFAEEIASREGSIVKIIEDEAINVLEKLEYPGNVRELKNIIYKAYVLSEETINKEIIEMIVINKKACCNSNVFDRKLTLDELERLYIENTLEKNEYHLTETAKTLGMEASNLSRKLKAMGIALKELKSSGV